MKLKMALLMVATILGVIVPQSLYAKTACEAYCIYHPMGDGVAVTPPWCESGVTACSAGKACSVQPGNCELVTEEVQGEPGTFRYVGCSSGSKVGKCK